MGHHPHRRRFAIHRLPVLFAASLALGCDRTPSCESGDVLPNATDTVQLIFQDPWKHPAPADRCVDSICTQLLEWIDGAESSIDFAVYGARDQTRILEALLDAEARGVQVRGYVDRDHKGNNYYSSTDDWVRRLEDIADDREREVAPQRSRNYYRPSCERPEGFLGPLQCLAYDLGDAWLLAGHASREDYTDPAKGNTNKIMHNKFFVIDSQKVWTGSANLSNSGTGGYNANLVAAIDSAALACEYRAEFDRLRERVEPKQKKPEGRTGALLIGDVEAELWFSPQDRPMRYGVQPLLAAARDRIDISIFFLTHKYVTAELIAAHQRGVQVRVIVDATSAKNGYTKHELLRVAGIPVKVENWGGKMHAKAAAIDGQTLVLGSMNWTGAGERTNDENTLILRSRRLAQQYGVWFEELWRSIPGQWLTEGARPDPESPHSGTACTDGVDNDFDRKVDAADPGCQPNPPALPELPPHRLVSKTEMPQIGADYRLYRSINDKDP